MFSITLQPDQDTKITMEVIPGVYVYIGKVNSQTGEELDEFYKEWGVMTPKEKECINTWLAEATNISQSLLRQFNLFGMK